MKKFNFRSFFMLLLVITSLGSYVFLNTVPTNSIANEVIEVEESTEQQFFLPDIELVKKFVDVSKMVLTRSSNN